MGMAQFPVPLAPSKLSIPGLNDYQNLKRYGNRHMENFSHASTDIWSTQRDPGSIQRAVNVEHCQGYKENQDSVATKVGLESIWPKPFEHVTTATTTGCSSSRWLDMSIGRLFFCFSCLFLQSLHPPRREFAIRPFQHKTWMDSR